MNIKLSYIALMFIALALVASPCYSEESSINNSTSINNATGVKKKLREPKVYKHLDKFDLPKGFKISVFAANLKGPRMMAFNPEGVLHVTLTGEGKVMAVIDEDLDWIADKKQVLLKGLYNPHGIAFYGGYLYIAETDKVTRYRQDPETLKLTDKEVVVDDLPVAGGGHFTRTIEFGPDGKMYVSVGSSCNVCDEQDPKRSTILRYNPDGTEGEIFAEGLRNSVGLAIRPDTGELFASDNGRDWLGEDLPPDEIDLIEQGGHYGWPHCYGDRVRDPQSDRDDFCELTEPPALKIQAHSAPLGIEFYTGRMFPAFYRGRLFVALHGSWNRIVPVGYKIISVPVSGGKITGRAVDFLVGWKQPRKMGRPVDIVNAPNGTLYISDDYKGYIYIVSY